MIDRMVYFYLSMYPVCQDDKFRLVLFRMLRLYRPMDQSPSPCSTPLQCTRYCLCAVHDPAVLNDHGEGPY